MSDDVGYQMELYYSRGFQRGAQEMRKAIAVRVTDSQYHLTGDEIRRIPLPQEKAMSDNEKSEIGVQFGPMSTEQREEVYSDRAGKIVLPKPNPQVSDAAPRVERELADLRKRMEAIEERFALVGRDSSSQPAVPVIEPIGKELP